jgi:HSP20 family protein
VSILKKPDPIKELQAIRELIDRLFQDRLKAGAEPAELEPLVPPVDLWETEDEVLLEAELPGVDAGDVVVEVKGKSVSIRGERKAAPATGVVQTVHRLERENGSFHRTFTLSKSVDRYDVETSEKDGILQVRLSKSGSKGRKKKG